MHAQLQVEGSVTHCHQLPLQQNANLRQPTFTCFGATGGAASKAAAAATIVRNRTAAARAKRGASTRSSTDARHVARGVLSTPGQPMRGNEITDGLPLAWPTAHRQSHQRSQHRHLPGHPAPDRQRRPRTPMPPRPASTSARQVLNAVDIIVEAVQHATKILERLAEAADLGAFVLPQLEADCLEAVAPVLSPSQPSSATADSPGRALLTAWIAAVSRGMQLAAQQLELGRLREHSAAINLLCNLVKRLSQCCLDLARSIVAGAPDDGKEPMRVALSVLAVRAGLVRAHEQLSLRLGRIISCPQAASMGAVAAQQHQQQQQIEPAVAMLVTDHLGLLSYMGRAWPAGGPCGLFSPSLSQTVPAAAGLAAAVLSNSDAIIRSEGGTYSTWQGTYSIVAVLGIAYGSAGSVPKQIAGSSSMARLLVMSLGRAAERLHQLQHGLSPAAVGAAPSAAAVVGAASAQQRRLAVPAHHTQLLQALGVAAGGVHPDSPMAAQDVTVWAQLLESLVAAPEQRQLLATISAAASCQQALLLVLLECLLLRPTLNLMEDAPATMHRVLAFSLHFHRYCAGEAAWQLGPALLRAFLEQDACRRALEAAPPPAAAPAPAAATDVCDRAASNPSMLGVLALLVVDINAHVVASVYNITQGDKAVFNRLLADLAALWLEHTAQCASLLEAGLRMLAHGERALRSASGAALAVEVAARARHSAGGGDASAADSQQQVLALLLSCVKTVAVAADNSSSGSSSSSSSSDSAAAIKDPDEVWKLARNVVQDVIDACGWVLAPSHNSSSSSSSSSSSNNQPSMAAPAASDAAAGLNAQMGCVLLARCLVAAGRLLQQQVQAPAKDGSSRQQMLLLSRLLPLCSSGVASLVQQLTRQAAAAAAAAEPWAQQLLQEHAPLEQQLKRLLAQMAAASGAAGNPASEPQPLPPAALAGVAEQLRAFGAAVCAALPVQQCCNHHDCSSLQQPSELELVGGKSCVCGGCRVARYCSRECQVAHYKGWHKAVCKRLQAQRQQAAQPAQQPETQQQQLGEWHSAE